MKRIIMIHNIMWILRFNMNPFIDEESLDSIKSIIKFEYKELSWQLVDKSKIIKKIREIRRVKII